MRRRRSDNMTAMCVRVCVVATVLLCATPHLFERKPRLCIPLRRFAHLTLGEQVLGVHCAHLLSLRLRLTHTSGHTTDDERCKHGSVDNDAALRRTHTEQ